MVEIQKRLYETISRYFHHLEDDVIIYPGHDYIKNNLKFTLSIRQSNEFAQNLLKELESNNSAFCEKLTTVSEEKEMNVFFRLGQETIRQHLNLATASDKEVFIKLRSIRDKW